MIAFGGHANECKDEPISVRNGEKVRIYVLSGGPSSWDASAVIGVVAVAPP